MSTAEKKKKIRRDLELWEVVNRKETAEPPEESDSVAPEEEDGAAAGGKEAYAKSMKNRRSPIESIDPSDLERFPESVRELLLTAAPSTMTKYAKARLH